MKSNNSEYKIPGFHGVEDSNHCCDTMQWYDRIPTFRRIMLPPSSGR